jgi:hypothetical protein
MVPILLRLLRLLDLALADPVARRAIADLLRFLLQHFTGVGS